MRNIQHVYAARILVVLASVSGALACQGCWDTETPMRTGEHPAPLSGHIVLLGDAYHSARYCDPLASCASCHGDTLQGGSNGEPSCTSCHDDRWNAENCGMSSHTVSLGGHLHDPAYCLPYQSCVACHGANLRGGAGGQPSCLSCHTQTQWMNCGSTLHSESKDGAMHASNPCLPSQSCVLCHGANLGGGPNGEPSCYECHGDRWTNCED